MGTNIAVPKGRADRLVPALAVAGGILSAAGFVLAFTIAPLVHGAEVVPELVAGQMVGNQLLFSQKIFYFHVPVAVASFIALAIACWHSVRYLMTRDASHDLRARTATEVALVFIVATMACGVPWTRFEWGVWWSWEPRLTTYLVLMLLAIAYFVLRAAFAENERQATYASVFGIVLFLDAPLCFAITRLVPNSTHPVVFRTDSGLPPDMLVPFLLCLAGMLLLAFALYRLRLSQADMQQRIEVLKEELDDLEEGR